MNSSVSRPHDTCGDIASPLAPSTSSSRAALTAMLSAIFSTVSLMSTALASTPAEEHLKPLVVTASRFPNDPLFSPVGATVIDAEEIRDAGIDDVNEAIRKLGGVYGRQSMSSPNDYALDLRGFGSHSNQNMVILLDGVRLSENELTTALLSSIPIDSVERIEIVRGGSSVLYGNGATGGTIQIITRRAQADTLHATVVGEAGSYGLRSGRASIAKGWENVALNAAYSRQRADNYRDNNRSHQENFSGTAQWFSHVGRLGVRLDLARADYGLAGSLTMAQFLENPRQTRSPQDFGAYDNDRITAFAERRLGPLELAGELSHREKTTRYSYSGSAITTVRSRETQFSPRARHLVERGTLKNELVAGFDFSEWNIANINGSNDAAQRARAAYVRDELQIASNARIALGLRREVFGKNSTAGGYDKAQGVNAWDVQASYAVLPALRLFGKTGQSYRLPTADENGFTNLAAGQLLQAQTSHDLEFGASWGKADDQASLTWFRHRLNKELFYDPTPTPTSSFGANVNLDPTRRQGIELQASARLHADVTLKANFQHLIATFTEGPHAGREMVLVPKNTASVRLNWQSGRQTASAGALWVDTQRYGNDFNNTCQARIPSYTTIDARYAVRMGAWELALTGNNLGNRSYFSQAFGCASGLYPDTGRALKFTARYDM